MIYYFCTLPLPPPQDFVAGIESQVMQYVGQYAQNFLQILVFIALIRALIK